MRTQVNFTRVNKMEAMYAWSRVTLKLKARVVQLVLSQRKYAFMFKRDPSYFSSILFTHVILLYEKFLQSDWLRAVVFQLI